MTGMLADRFVECNANRTESRQIVEPDHSGPIYGDDSLAGRPGEACGG